MAVSHSRKSVADIHQGPWMDHETLAALPQLKRDYDHNANPERKAMVDHMQKPERQRRQESVVYEAQLKASNAAQIQKSPDRAEQDQGEQSSGEQSDGRGSAMVGKEQPKLTLRPPEQIARAANQSAFKSSWLAEQRDAAFAAANKVQGHAIRTQEPTHDRQLDHSEPKL